MNKILSILILLIIVAAIGCGNKVTIEPPGSDKVLLTVDFHENLPLKYRFISERDITVDWNQNTNAAQPDESALNESNEKLDVTMLYNPIEINPFGITTIKATCQSIQVTRNDIIQKDAVDYISGKSFTFTIDSSGKIHDYSQLDELLKETGQKAFSGTGNEKIKQPEMIGDFIATQWFLWDSISSIENPSHGIGIAQSWASKLSVPTPMVSRLARDVTYTLEEIQESENGNIAIITSEYEQSDSAAKSWPVPYTGSFRMQGTFGLLSNYKLLELSGNGEEFFNIDMGQTEQYNQNYTMKIQASLPLMGNVKPLISINQTISMKLLK